MSAQAPKPLPPEVTSALQQGKLIEAIRLLRTSGNFDLKQAKEAIEQHLDRSKVGRATVSEAVGALLQNPAVAEALRRGNRIEAIRILREKTGLGLKEAKEAVERFPPAPGGSASSAGSASTASSGSIWAMGSQGSQASMTSMDGDNTSSHQSMTPTQQLSRPGLAPGEVRELPIGRWVIVALIIIGALLYYVSARYG